MPTPDGKTTASEFETEQQELRKEFATISREDSAYLMHSLERASDVVIAENLEVLAGGRKTLYDLCRAQVDERTTELMDAFPRIVNMNLSASSYETSLKTVRLLCKEKMIAWKASRVPQEDDNFVDLGKEFLREFPKLKEHPYFCPAAFKDLCYEILLVKSEHELERERRKQEVEEELSKTSKNDKKIIQKTLSQGFQAMVDACAVDLLESTQDDNSLAAKVWEEPASAEMRSLMAKYPKTAAKMCKDQIDCFFWEKKQQMYTTPMEAWLTNAENKANTKCTECLRVFLDAHPALAQQPSFNLYECTTSWVFLYDIEVRCQHVAQLT
jgi:hypothetical protein